MRRQGPRHPGPGNTERRRQRKKKPSSEKEVGRGEDHKTPRPKATRGRKTRNLRDKGGVTGKRSPNNNHKQGNPSPEGPNKRRSAPRPATGKGEAHQNAPGRPARPTLPRGARTRSDARDPGVASSDPKWSVSASIRNDSGATAESPVKRGVVWETGRVSDRIHTRK